MWSARSLVLYHGTDDASASRILKAGVQATPPRPGLDFGPGFYTTTSLAQAWRWAEKRVLRRQGPGPAQVIRFETTYDDIARLESIAFVRSDPEAEDYWAFVGTFKAGARLHHRPPPAGNFAVVLGPLAVRPSRRLAIPDTDQVSFHAPVGLAFINTCATSLEPPQAGL